MSTRSADVGTHAAAKGRGNAAVGERFQKPLRLLLARGNERALLDLVQTYEIDVTGSAAQELGKRKGKDSRIKLNKINDYIQALSVYGTAQLSENFVKHLDGEIWELRPLRDRILFAGVVGGQYVLLHQFVKRTQKTPAREIEQAKRELADFIERRNLHE